MEPMKRNELKNIISSFQIMKMEEIKTSPHFLTVIPFRVTLEDKTTFVREKLMKGKKDGSAVIIFAVTEEHDVLLVVEPRVFTKEGVGVGLPAGYIEEEDVLDAAKRELKEETGYGDGQWTIMGSFYQDEGCSSALNYSVLALNCKKVGEQKLDFDEHIQLFLCPLEGVEELLEDGTIKGANSCLTIEHAKRYIKKLGGKNV